MPVECSVLRASEKVYNTMTDDACDDYAIFREFISTFFAFICNFFFFARVIQEAHDLSHG
jgi:uncharacterized membrane protein